MGFEISNSILVPMMQRLLKSHPEGVTNSQIREALACSGNQYARVAINDALRSYPDTYKRMNLKAHPAKWGLHGEITYSLECERTRNTSKAQVFSIPLIEPTETRIVYFGTSIDFDTAIFDVARRFIVHIFAEKKGQEDGL